MNNVESQLNALLQGEFSGLVYFYTPICGTCQVASKMLAVVEELPLQKYVMKIDLNYYAPLAEKLKIESVPCLLVVDDGTIKDRIYAFKSVVDLIERIQ
jgi:thioredoxin 1